MDAFARLGLERRLAYSEEELREAFREAGRRFHPDAGGEGGEFQALQEAFRLLSSPSRRLRHWLELSGIPGDERGALGPELMDLFTRTGETLQGADALIRRRESARSALARAMLEAETQQTREKIEAAQEILGRVAGERIAFFPVLERGDGDPWQIVRDLAFLEKWQGQLRGRYAKLW